MIWDYQRTVLFTRKLDIESHFLEIIIIRFGMSVGRVGCVVMHTVKTGKGYFDQIWLSQLHLTLLQIIDYKVCHTLVHEFY